MSRLQQIDAFFCFVFFDCSVDMHSYVVAFCPHHSSAMHVIVLSFQTPVEVLTQDQVVSAHRSVIDILSRKFRTNHLSQVEHLSAGFNLVVSKSTEQQLLTKCI